VIIFINGPFGVGKTTVADLLVDRLPGSLLFDAKLIGAFLRQIVTPIENPDDFQDLPLWRSLTVTTAQQLLATYGRPLIMPMSIWRPAYFREIVGGLRAVDPACHHFTLTASAATLEARIRASDEAVAWRLAHLQPCTTALAAPEFATHIATDERMPGEVADAIIERLGFDRTR
jgi:hypothetical protein